MDGKIFTRREFLRDSSVAALAGAVYLNLPKNLFSQSGKKSRVVLIRDKELLDNFQQPKPEILEKMLDEAMLALLDSDDVLQPWGKIIRPDDIVGIKTNVWHYLRTPESLERIIKKKVIEVGVPEQNIGINDRGVLSDPIFQKCTALINVRPMRTHNWSGVGTLLKNYIMFVNTPSAYHSDSCADLAIIWKKPHILGKTRLNILLMITPQFHSIGPHSFNQKYVWGYSGMLVGFDPVAVDSTGVRIIRAKRREYFGEDRPINPPPKHIFLADTRHHLGTADPNKIDLIKLGWKKGILI